MSNYKTYSYTASVVEGLLYEIDVEDGVAVTFDCLVEVLLPGNVRMIHKTFYASGRGKDERGCTYLAYSRSEAQRFADRVNARGYIDLRYWEPAPEPTDTLEERLEGYAREEQIERNGGRL